MKRSLRFRAVVLLAGASILGASGGCTEWLSTANVVSFGLGWLLRDVTVPTTVVRECYQNGEPVDCATVSLDSN